MTRPPLLNTTLRWFLFTMILANTASRMVFAVLPVYFKEMGASIAEIGFIFSAASLVPLVLQIFGGWLSDSIGRLRTIALGALGGSLGYILFVFAPTWQWALLALGLEYISGALVGPSFSAFIAEQSNEETRGRVFGVVNGIFLIVGVIGPLIGGLLASYSFRFMLGVACVLYLCAALVRVWMATTTRFVKPIQQELLSLVSLRTQMLGMFGLLIGGGALTWVFITDGVRDVAFRLSAELQPLYYDQIGKMDVTQIGWVSSIFGVAMMVSTLPAGWLADKRGERLTIMGGFFLQFLGLAIFLISGNFWGFAAAIFVFGLGIGVISPAYDSFVSKIVPENMRGIAFGLLQTSLGIISLPAPWLGAQLWEKIDPRVPFAITAIAILLAIVPVWFKFVLPKKESQLEKS